MIRKFLPLLLGLQYATLVQALDVVDTGTNGGAGQPGGNASAVAVSADPTNSATATGGVRDSKLESRFTALLPVDVAQGLLRHISHTVTELLADGEHAGVKMVLKTKTIDSRKAQYTYPTR